jgi:uncharacterized protein
MSAVLAIQNNQEEVVDFFNKGLSFSTGVGEEMDLVEAHKFFNLAALRGNSEAKERRREISEIMTENQISAAQRAARDWLNRAAK